MNYPTQQTIIRGTYSGVVKIPDAEMTMDYAMFRDIGQKERDAVYEELKTRLENMLPWNMVKNQADLMQNTMEILKTKPLGGFYAI